MFGLWNFLDRLTMSHKYEVHTQTKGILKFNELPENVYWGQGFQFAEDKNKAFWFGFDNGTCLIPFLDLKGNFIYKEEDVPGINRTSFKIKLDNSWK